MRCIPFGCLMTVWLMAGLIATGARAQTEEALQDRLVDTVNRATQQADAAAEHFRTNDIAGGCLTLRAASAGMDRGLSLARQLPQDSALNDRLRDRLWHDLQDMVSSLTVQKQDMDSEIGSRCH